MQSTISWSGSNNGGDVDIGGDTGNGGGTDIGGDIDVKFNIWSYFVKKIKMLEDFQR